MLSGKMPGGKTRYNWVKGGITGRRYNKHFKSTV